jgi:hypothetical protein
MMVQRLGYAELRDSCAFHVKQLGFSTLGEMYEKAVEFEAQVSDELHRSEKG